MIKIRAFRAIDDYDACLRFIEGHRRLLEIHFGVAKVTSASNDWVKSESTIVLIVENETGDKVYGGGRVQMVDGKIPLPIETALGHYDPKVHDMVQPGCAEICGMWNSMEVAGMGIGSLILGRICVAIVNQLPIDKIYVLCAPVTTRMGKRVGAVVEERLGDKGIFFYPKDDFVATAMAIYDVDVLEHAEENERQAIFDLRLNPNQVRLEKGPKGEFEVNYNLEIPNNIFVARS
jgi:hypothetical protein